MILFLSLFNATTCTTSTACAICFTSTTRKQHGETGAGSRGPRWERQVTPWEALPAKYGISSDRYEELKNLTYLPIGDRYVCGYWYWRADKKGRIKSYFLDYAYVDTLLKESTRIGVKICLQVNRYECLANKKSAISSDTVPVPRVLRFDFLEMFDAILYCNTPLQVI